MADFWFFSQPAHPKKTTPGVTEDCFFKLRFQLTNFPSLLLLENNIGLLVDQHMDLL